jgi:hypothetical protein
MNSENKLAPNSAQVVMVRFLTVQIKESVSQFSTPLYLPPGQKKRGVSGHINHSWRVDANWGIFAVQKKSRNKEKR